MKKFINLSSFIVILIGILFIIAGISGICFTYKSVARENITTPDDATIASKPVRGPLTLKAQADIIRKHMYTMSGDKTYAEMPRQIAKLDEKGAEVVGPDGKPIMIPNTSRDTWITATTLITALHLGILAYAFSLFVIIIGFISIWAGVVVRYINKTQTISNI